jgi:hypothetical protein
VPLGRAGEQQESGEHWSNGFGSHHEALPI